ncbi:MAG: protein translocase subunit SecD, partial [Notoacmeibacter sp.]|nr:protein translocase subunit SecD [Notoacmeibacter sp.]
MLYFSRWKTVLIWLSVLAGLLFAAPNFFSKDTLAIWPDWAPSAQMPLGLDLQGGSHILLKIEQ